MTDYTSSLNKKLKKSQIILASNFNNLSFINDGIEVEGIEHREKPHYIRVSVGWDGENHRDISTQIPLLFNHNNKINIPTKVETAIRRHISKKILRDIHPDLNVAVELCLLFITHLVSTYFEMIAGESDGSRALKAEYLREYFSMENDMYIKIRTALEYPLRTGAILLCDHISIEGSKSFHYRLGDAYLGKGLVSYQLKTKEATGLLNRHYERLYREAMHNPICRNLIQLYPQLTLPTKEEVLTEARRLVNNKHTNRKLKRLVFQNKHAKSYFKNPDDLTFVEDGIRNFEYLTRHGLMIPRAGNDRSGGRVVDSFTLMTSWIRKMITIDGVRLREADYSCLHPNIAIALYGGKQGFITHDKVALALGIPKDTVKVEHLSFFNKTVAEMKRSPIYPYYKEHEPEMLARIEDEKMHSIYKYIITSRRLFKKEVEIMTDVIVLLNREGIYPLYIYDALSSHPDHALRLQEVMDSVILSHGVRTKAKLSDDVPVVISTKKIHGICTKTLLSFFKRLIKNKNSIPKTNDTGEANWLMN